MEKLLFADKNIVSGRAIFLGQKLDLNDLERSDSLATQPLVVTAGEGGFAVLFEYGVVVLFGMEPVEIAAFLNQLNSLVVMPFPAPETEEVVLRLDAAGAGRVENGTIWLSEFDIGRLQIVADVLAKSVVLAHYELNTASVFDQIEPFAAGLQRSTKNQRWGKDLLGQLGRALSIQHKIIGRVEIIDKPEMLWDEPNLERLYMRLEDEYEIRERYLALDRKLGLISSTAETVLGLMQHNTTLRVEWYVVILIVVEILLSLYDLFLNV